MRTYIIISTVALLNWGTTVSVLAHPGAGSRVTRRFDGMNSRQIHNNDYAGGQPSSGTDQPGDSAPPNGGVSRKRQAPVNPNVDSPAAPASPSVTLPGSTAPSSSSGSSSAPTKTGTETETPTPSPDSLPNQVAGKVESVVGNPGPSSSSSSSSSSSTTSSSSAAESTTPASNSADGVVAGAKVELQGSSSESNSASTSTTPSSSSPSPSATDPPKAVQNAAGNAKNQVTGKPTDSKSTSASVTPSTTPASSSAGASVTNPAQRVVANMGGDQ